MLDIVMMTGAIMRFWLVRLTLSMKRDDSLGGNFLANNSITACNGTINQLAVDRNLENTA